MDEKIPDRIACWLLNSGIQIDGGAETGAVAGWLDADGKPAFAYPEITGYYLTCLAFMHRLGRTEPEITRNAARAVAWLNRTCRNDLPRTRHYTAPDVSDWRNDATFSFDFAMILRGLASVRGLVDETLRSETEACLLRHMVAFAGVGNQILPFIARGRKRIPDRWSTRPGPFQLKTAGALLSACNYAPDKLRSAALTTLELWRDAPDTKSGQLHAGLYGVEGLILFAIQGYLDAWNAAAVHYHQCLRAFASMRSDIVAQTLRAGCLLYHRGVWRPAHWDKTLRRFSERLEDFVGASGAVYYDSSRAHQNAWSAMFAYQALTLYNAASETNGAECFVC